MKHLYYNRQKNNLTKSAVLGSFTIVAFWVLNFFIRTVDRESINMYHVLFFTFVIIVVSYLLRRVPFGQVLESSGDKKFETYYRLGPLKLNRQQWGQVDNVVLEQDAKRFYCLVIKTAKGENLQVEKYPTLKQSEERLNAFKELFI